MCQELGIFTLTNIFHVAVRLFSNKSQKTLKCVKTKKWHTSRADVFRPHFDVLSDLLLNRTHGNMESVCFIRCLRKKGKKTDTHTCLVPLDCQKICASLGIFYIQALLFVSGSSFFLYLTLYTVSLKRFSTSFLVQTKIMAKTLGKTASFWQR